MKKTKVTNFTVKQILDLFRLSEIDVDIYDDYDERCGIAYCGEKLTKKAEEKYARALALPVACLFKEEFGLIAVSVHCENAEEADALKDLLEAAAGYIGAEEYDELFNDED